MKPTQVRNGSLCTMAVLLALAGCADPSSRIASELTRYGLDKAQATCVGERLEAGLSTGQLQELARAARSMKADDTTPGQLTSGDLMRAVARINDPQIPVEVAKAGARCGVLTGASVGGLLGL